MEKTKSFYRNILFLESLSVLKSPAKIMGYMGMLANQPRKFFSLSKRLFAIVFNA